LHIFSQIGTNLEAVGARVINAKGKLVMPGKVLSLKTNFTEHRLSLVI